METITCPTVESNGHVKQRNILTNGNGTIHKPSNGHVPNAVSETLLWYFSTYACMLYVCVCVARTIFWNKKCIDRKGQCHRIIYHRFFGGDIPFFYFLRNCVRPTNMSVWGVCVCILNCILLLCLAVRLTFFFFYFRLFSVPKQHRGRGKIWIGKMFGFSPIYTFFRCMRSTLFSRARQNCWR